MQKSWGEALHDGIVSGTIAGLATAATAAICGARESGSAVAPVNATSHVLFGEEAGTVEGIDAKHTPLGFAIHMGSAIFWATLYEKAFGAAADRGDVTKAFAGGKAVASLAYLTDYHAVPKRLTPGWEERISAGSLALVFSALALSLPLRGLWKSRTSLPRPH